MILSIYLSEIKLFNTKFFHQIPGTQTFLDLTGLKKNIPYLIQIRGTSRSGQGPASQPLVLTIPAPQRPVTKVDKGRPPGEQAALPGRVEHDQTLGE